MPRMFDLANIFELVIDRFNDRSLTYQPFINQAHQRILHILAQSRDQLESQITEQLLKQWLGEIAFVADEFAE